MEEKSKILKIKLDVPERTVDYFRVQENWENEGGSTQVYSKISHFPDDTIPLQPGDQFKVLNGTIERIDNNLFYIAEIEKVNEKKIAANSI